MKTKTDVKWHRYFHSFPATIFPALISGSPQMLPTLSGWSWLMQNQYWNLVSWHLNQFYLHGIRGTSVGYPVASVVLTVCVESTKLCHPGTFLAFDQKYDSCMSSFLVPLLMPVTAHSAHGNRRHWHRFHISTCGSDSFLMSCQFSITGLYRDLTGPLLTDVRTGY